MNATPISAVFVVSVCCASEVELRRLVAISRIRYKNQNMRGWLLWCGRYLTHIVWGTPEQLSSAVQKMTTDGRQAAPRILMQWRVADQSVPQVFFDYGDGRPHAEAVEKAYEGQLRLADIQALYDQLLRNPVAESVSGRS